MLADVYIVPTFELRTKLSSIRTLDRMIPMPISSEAPIVDAVTATVELSTCKANFFDAVMVEDETLA